MQEKNNHFTPYETREAFIQASLSLFNECYQEAIKKHNSFIVAVSGGSTPIPFFEELALPMNAAQYDWEKIQFFWVDERMVPNHSPENNFNNAYHAFLRKVPLPYPNKHRIPTFKDPHQIAREYEAEIVNLFKQERGLAEGAVPVFDLILLGMGEDGHTASLFPTSPDLNEEKKLMMATEKPESGQMRITMTFPLLAAAQNLILMATGEKKIQIIEKVIQNGLLHLPIAKLNKRHPNIIWVSRE